MINVDEDSLVHDTLNTVDNYFTTSFVLTWLDKADLDLKLQKLGRGPVYFKDTGSLKYKCYRWGNTLFARGTAEGIRYLSDLIGSVAQEAPKDLSGRAHIKQQHYLEGRMQSKDSYIHAKDLEVMDFLNPGLDVKTMTRQYLTSPENLLIFVGPPGTGKTSLIKAIISIGVEMGLDKVIYTKDTSLLGSQAFWSQQFNGCDLVILDDVDGLLTPRNMEGENTFTTNILSVTNGVFPSKTKFIISTNLHDGKIDSALARPGRCFDILNLKTLTEDQAIDIWTTKLGLELKDYQFSGNVSQAALISEAEKLQTKASIYLTDKSLSIRNNYV
jgi:hypothetical protein